MSEKTADIARMARQVVDNHMSDWPNYIAGLIQNTKGNPARSHALKALAKDPAVEVHPGSTEDMHYAILKDFLDKLPAPETNNKKKKEPEGPCPNEDIRAAIKQYQDETGEICHPLALEVTTLALIGQNVYLYGPAGCGKSYLAGQVAGILSRYLKKDIRFCDMVCGPNFTEFDMLAKASPMRSQEDLCDPSEHKGPFSSILSIAHKWLSAFFKKGGLDIVESPFMSAFENGNSLALIDENDVTMPECNLAINGALASRRQFNPAKSKVVEVGENFFFIAAGNTNLKGPTPEFPARQAQDSAYISRFSGGILKMDYSPELEEKILHPEVKDFIQNLRSRVRDSKNGGIKGSLRVELSTRLGINLSNQIRSGRFTSAQVFRRWAVELSDNERSLLGIDMRAWD